MVRKLTTAQEDTHIIKVISSYYQGNHIKVYRSKLHPEYSFCVNLSRQEVLFESRPCQRLDKALWQQFIMWCDEKGFIPFDVPGATSAGRLRL